MCRLETEFAAAGKVGEFAVLKRCPGAARREGAGLAAAAVRPVE
jgi:hypothetical protein